MDIDKKEIFHWLVVTAFKFYLTGNATLNIISRIQHGKKGKRESHGKLQEPPASSEGDTTQQAPPLEDTQHLCENALLKYICSNSNKTKQKNAP